MFTVKTKSNGHSEFNTQCVCQLYNFDIALSDSAEVKTASEIKLSNNKPRASHMSRVYCIFGKSIDQAPRVSSWRLPVSGFKYPPEP